MADVGAVDLELPRDRNVSFDAQIVRNGQTRPEDFKGRIIALYVTGHDHPRRQRTRRRCNCCPGHCGIWTRWRPTTAMSPATVMGPP